MGGAFFRYGSWKLQVRKEHSRVNKFVAPHLTFVQIHVSVTHTQRRTVTLLAEHLAYTLRISLWHLHWLF